MTCPALALTVSVVMVTSQASVMTQLSTGAGGIVSVNVEALTPDARMI